MANPSNSLLSIFCCNALAVASDKAGSAAIISTQKKKERDQTSYKWTCKLLARANRSAGWLLQEPALERPWKKNIKFLMKKEARDMKVVQKIVCGRCSGAG